LDVRADTPQLVRITVLKQLKSMVLLKGEQWLLKELARVILGEEVVTILYLNLLKMNYEN
jgi:hypothetical protein